MFMVTEADTAAIRTAFHEKGELSAVIELRRRLSGIADLRRRGPASEPSQAGTSRHP